MEKNLQGSWTWLSQNLLNKLNFRHIIYMKDRKGLQHISVTMQEIWEAMRPNVYKNKKKYNRKKKHKKDGSDI